MRRITLIPVAVTAALMVMGGAAYAATAMTAQAPNNGAQLTGTVYVCVQESNESHQYVELGNPEVSNCAPGYLQYTANQPAVTPDITKTTALVNSEDFTYDAHGNQNESGCSQAKTENTFCVSLPSGASLTGTPVVTDEDATANGTATVDSVDDVTGLVTVSWPTNVTPALAAPFGMNSDTIQVTYDYTG
jgi:hypothetical protein